MNQRPNRIIDIKRTESSPVESCTLVEAKAQAIVTYSDDDSLFTALITKARKMIENYCNISIAVQNVTLTADLYNEWELPYGPVTGITSVKTRTGTEGSGPATYNTATTGWNTDGTEFLSFTPQGAGNFDVNRPFTGNIPGPDPANRYRIIYTTGYNPVPDDLKQAVLIQIAWLYEHRGEESVDVCAAARILADPYKRMLWI